MFKKTDKDIIIKGYKRLLKRQREIEKALSNEQREYDYKAKKMENKHNEIVDSLLIEQRQVAKELGDIKDFIDDIKNNIPGGIDNE